MGRNSKNRKIFTRSESGTCNVCSAPCSSCLHINRGSTTVKAEESSGETCQDNVGSQYSVTDVPVKISEQHAASETSNANINSDVYFNDGTSKAGLKSNDDFRKFDDTEMPPTLSSGRNVERHCDKKAAKIKYEERKGKEGREDNTSCVTGGSDSNKLTSNKSLGLRHGLEELSSPKNELIEISCSEDKNKGVRPSKLPSTISDPSSGKSSSCTKELKETGSKERFSLSSTKEESFDLGLRQEELDRCNESRSVALDKVCLKLEEETYTGNSVASEKVGLNLDSETQADTVPENQPNKSVNSSVQNKEIEKMESWELSDVQENNTQSQSMMDSDESDVLEHDVKVCDICGDAGREDKLAICSRCSDGAEHTYCMREMIDKVPEGEWLCEECKSCDEIKSKDAVGAAAVSGKYRSSEVASAGDTDLLNEDGKHLDADATKTRKKIWGKRDMDDRRSEDIETASDAKRQARGSTVESLRSPRRVASHSRDSSVKNLNKGELRPPHQSYSTGGSNNETLEDAASLRGLRQQTARSTLSKSNSFCTNVKSKLDFSNEVHQKQKSAYTNKEGASRLLGRSMSFKPSTSSRLNSSESKVKMLPSRFTHPQDGKGSRQTKAINTLERRSSFKPEGMVNTIISSSTDSASNADQKLAPFDPIVSNNSELKGVPADSKPSTLSRTISYTTRKGDMKISSISEQRLKEAGPRDDSSSGTHTSEKSFCKSRGGLLGISSRPQDTEVGERIRESSVIRSRTSIDSPRDIVNDASATRSSADVIKGNKLKAAIEAAMLKKPGICRKNKPADQSDEMPMPSTNANSDTRTEDHLLTLSKKRSMSVANEAHEEQATSSNGDQNSLPFGGPSLKVGGSCCPIVSSGLSNQHSATVSVLLKMPVLPEHEYSWQGGFDIRKIGKLPNLRDGLQAHLSTFASPKVLEVVNKFPSKLLLNEVPRLRTWPVQFQEAGVKEDNIALYFFAKDLDSYERSYKSLLEIMMKKDVALTGNFDGVELLIFPSNHLPQNAQRWNMLYFLWGVFRKKKVSVQNVSDSDALIPSKASECPTNLNANSKHPSSLVSEGHTSEIVRGACDAKVYSSGSSGQSLQGNVENRVDAKRISGLSVPETKGPTISLEDKVDTKTKIKPDVAKFQPSVQDAKKSLSNTQLSPSRSGSPAQTSPSDKPETLERTVKEEDKSNDVSFFSHGKRLREIPILLEGESANRKQEIDSSVIGLADNNTSPKMVPKLGHAIEGESANKKQKIDSSVIGLADNNTSPKMVPKLGLAIEGETNAPKRGFELDLNEAQDYTPDSPIPAAKEEKGCLFDLNIAQDYPPDNDDEGGGPSLPLPLPLPLPFLNKDPEVIPASNIEPVLPARPNTRSSRLFFNGLSK